MNVLAIGCHPDDVEVNCAGTLVKCVQRGDKVTVCHVANGNLGHELINEDELREMRALEAKKAELAKQQAEAEARREATKKAVETEVNYLKGLFGK